MDENFIKELILQVYKYDAGARDSVQQSCAEFCLQELLTVYHMVQKAMPSFGASSSCRPRATTSQESNALIVVGESVWDCLPPGVKEVLKTLVGRGGLFRRQDVPQLPKDSRLFRSSQYGSTLNLWLANWCTYLIERVGLLSFYMFSVHYLRIILSFPVLPNAVETKCL